MITRIFSIRIPKLGQKAAAPIFFCFLAFLISFPLFADVKPISDAEYAQKTIVKPVQEPKPPKPAPAAKSEPALQVSQLQPVDQAQETGPDYIFRDRFFLAPKMKLAYDTREPGGFLVINDNRADWDSKFAVITGFDSTTVESYPLQNIRFSKDIEPYIKKNSKSTQYLSVPIKALSLTKKDGSKETFYWVGNQSFSTSELAQASIIAAKTEIEASGGNFDRALELIYEYAPEEPKALSDEEMKADFAREEEIAIKVMDWLDIGERPFGVLSAPSPAGEKLLWQSFGETTFKTTNLEADEYNAQTGFWSNRFVIKGLRGPFGTSFDPYVEVTPAMESNGIDFKSNMKLVGGVGWYPFLRSAALQNFRPVGIPLIDFIRSYRLYVQYLYRENLKDEILGSKDTDLWAGVDIFYEWGHALPPLGTKPETKTFANFLYNYVWGEYFGNYRWQKTDFSSIPHYQSWILNSSFTLGVKWPSIPLPENPVNNELTFMPYLRFEHVNNPNHPLFYQNYFLTAAGLRLMPFRSYQFSENEWLFKTKLFVEYIGVPSAIRYSANTPTNTPGRDLRFGVAFSYRRF